MKRAAIHRIVSSMGRLYSQLHRPSAKKLRQRTTLRVGGPADLYVEPTDETDLATVLRFCHDRDVPFFLLGSGSNLLIRDGGIPGAISCTRGMLEFWIDPESPYFREVFNEDREFILY
mgnify:CR=1 FL=1